MVLPKFEFAAVSSLMCATRGLQRIAGEKNPKLHASELKLIYTEACFSGSVLFTL